MRYNSNVLKGFIIYSFIAPNEYKKHKNLKIRPVLTRFGAFSFPINVSLTGDGSTMSDRDTSEH